MLIAVRKPQSCDMRQISASAPSCRPISSP